MSRLTIPFALCALLAAPVLTRATEVRQTGSSPMLKGPDPADCAQANSDYERYELGCPIDEAVGGLAASTNPPLDGSPAIAARSAERGSR